MICSLCSSAATIYQQDGYSFTDLGENTISVCGWDNRTSELIIPNKIADYYVAEISDYSFLGNKEITQLDLTHPTNLRRVGMYAFADCSALTGEVVFPIRITDIDQSAFENCSQLESAIIYANIDTIKRQSFFNCSLLSKVEIPSSVKTIDALAFSNCGSLYSVSIPNSVTEISSSAFRNDRNLTIKCYYKSYAYHYAIDNNINYSLLDSVRLGDVNGDEVVDINDVTQIQYHIPSAKL